MRNRSIKKAERLCVIPALAVSVVDNHTDMRKAARKGPRTLTGESETRGVTA